MNNINEIVIELPEIDLDNNSILKISIDKKWTASDFNIFFGNIDIIYRSRFLTYKAIREASNFISNPNNNNVTFLQFAHTPLAHVLDSIKWKLTSIDGENFIYRNIFPVSFEDKMLADQLIVVKIHYASPGATDFLGIAGILKEIKESLMYYFPNQNDKEKYEIAKQQKIELQIKNLKAIGFSDIEIRTIILREDVKLERISKFIEQGLISNVELIESQN